jgi:hypothetical protein
MKPFFFNILTELNKYFSILLLLFVVEECRLLECGAVGIYYKPTFRWNVSPPSSG